MSWGCVNKKKKKKREKKDKNLNHRRVNLNGYEGVIWAHQRV
jgi:hypothetical protein